VSGVMKRSQRCEHLREKVTQWRQGNAMLGWTQSDIEITLKMTNNAKMCFVRFMGMHNRNSKRSHGSE
jgi:hypothetical protein